MISWKGIRNEGQDAGWSMWSSWQSGPIASWLDLGAASPLPRRNSVKRRRIGEERERPRTKTKVQRTSPLYERENKPKEKEREG